MRVFYHRLPRCAIARRVCYRLWSMAGFVPTREAFRELAREAPYVPVWREVIADSETPVSAYAALRRRAGRGASFLLESVVGGETWAAYSFVGLGVRARFVASGGAERGRVIVERHDLERGGTVAREERVVDGADPTGALAALVEEHRTARVPGLPRFHGGAVGYFAYDVVRAFERLPSRTPDELELPDASFVIPDALVIFDNLRQTVKVVVAARGGDGVDLDASYARAQARIDEVLAALDGDAPARLRRLPAPGAERAAIALTHRTAKAEFLSAVARAKEYILAGDVFQVVLSQRFSAPRGGTDPFDVYRALRALNPSPYMFHLDFPEAEISGASPEVLVRVEDGRVMVRPIAGTRPRGATPEEDARLEAELRADPKEIAEHVMLIDLGRNDVGRVAELGSVRVDERMVVERYSHVMHLVSNVTGRLQAGRGPLDVLRACFPAGTLSGAPKIRAMEIIEELEPVRRGLYGGAVGYVSSTGNMDFAIAIRSLLARGDRVFVQAGAGIVADSDPEAEYAETIAKARAVVRALELARPDGS
jgi:anthranilate synthase component 1